MSTPPLVFMASTFLLALLVLLMTCNTPTTFNMELQTKNCSNSSQTEEFHETVADEGFWYPGDAVRKHSWPLPVPMQVMEQYIREHSGEALRLDPHPQRRKYALAFYQCPVSAGNRLHHFWNNLLWAILTNRTVLWKYWDQESCLAYSHYHKGLCKAANTQDDCAKILDRAPWMASYDEWKPMISFNDTDDQPFVVPDHVTMMDDTITLPPNYREDWGIDLESKYPHKVLVLPIGYDKFSDLASEALQRKLVKTKWARTRVKDLFSLGDDFLYGMLHKYTFQFTKHIRASTQTLLQQHAGDDKNFYTIGLHSRHRYPELDGCDIHRETNCLKEILAQRENKTRPVQVRIMSDRPCTMDRLTDWLQARKHSVMTVIHNETSPDKIAEHGPFAGAAFFEDLALVASSRSALIAMNRSSSDLMRELIVFDHAMEQWQSSGDIRQTVDQCVLPFQGPRG